MLCVCVCVCLCAALQDRLKGAFASNEDCKENKYVTWVLKQMQGLGSYVYGFSTKPVQHTLYMYKIDYS